jgi:multiple sugar transport system substrate-binding protein
MTSRPTRPFGTTMSRRTFVKGLAIGGGAVALGGLAACGGDGGGGGGGGSNLITLGSNASDAVPKEALAGVIDAFEKKSGKTVKINTVEHEVFQEQLNSYLQGTPDDVFTWFAGFRMQFFAEQGLATPVTPVWDKIGDEYSEAFKEASTSTDGEQYFIPTYDYPWAVFYRKSVFEENGWETPVTLDEWKGLLEEVQGKGMVPLAFADKEGWPAMGTFDYLDMRTNGYDFHIALMRGEEAWNDDRVKQVFTTWAELLPYHQEGSLGREWQEAAQSFAKKDAAMMVMGQFVGQQFTDEERPDLDFFPFPEINPEHGQGAVEAPIDGFMLSKDPKNLEGSYELLEYLGSAEAQEMYLKTDPNNVAANSTADTSNYTELQKKGAELIANAENISQYLDRDTRPDFSSTVMIPSLQDFINNPDDIDGLLDSVEEQKQAIFAG